MYGVFSYIWLIFMANVLNIPSMDPMGDVLTSIAFFVCVCMVLFFPFQCLHVFDFGGNVESSSRFVEPHLRLLFRDGGELGLEKTTAEH